MKKCELCEKVARMYCDSDQASLCWDCDSRVHTANFLVAKHTRTLLCHACQRPTPWTGSGPNLGPTVSACQACVNGRNRDMDGDRRHGNGNGDSEDEDDGDNDEDNEENDDSIHEDEDDDDDDDDENQVVPLSLPPSLASTSSSSEDSSSRRDGFFGSSSGSSKTTATIGSPSFSYNEIEKAEENGAQNFRSWRWR